MTAIVTQREVSDIVCLYSEGKKKLVSFKNPHALPFEL